MIKTDLKQMLSSLTIVYIEDDDNIRENFCEFFERFHANIFCTSNAEDGLELYKTKKPDIMVVDINLPNMSGIELVSQLRQEDKLTRFIITTAYTNPEFTLQAIELDITRYIVKPITSNTLLPALEKSLQELQKTTDIYTDIHLAEGFVFNLKKEQLFCNGVAISLRKKELLLLKLLLQNKDAVVSYEMIERKLWDELHMTDNAIRGQVRNLRRKTHQNIIKNISGIGYKINCKE
ncbi:MAG: response regulator transcription factor [Arcobacteraceae bacterium]|nr:response regulator transcription factor [Arcobacteraceae bacterium]